MHTKKIGIAFLLLIGLATGLIAIGSAAAQAEMTTMQWDIFSLNFSDGTLNAGGASWSRAEDGSVIRLTGSGTFVVGEADSVTGGGDWMEFDPAGNPTGDGTYTVTSLVTYVEGPGTLEGTGLVDKIGALEDTRAGLLVLQVAYVDEDGNDAGTGVLSLSCQLIGTPLSVFEGITASKGIVLYWNHAPAVPLLDANQTLFHVVTS